MRELRPIGNAIAWSLDRKNARIVGIARFGQDVQSPERVADNREVGGPIAEDRFAGQLLEQIFRPPGIFEELLRGLAKDLFVGPGMGGHLVSLGVHLPDQVGKRLGEFGQHEERGAHAAASQNVEQAARVVGRPRGNRQAVIPGRLRPIFDIGRDDRRAEFQGFRHT